MFGEVASKIGCVVIAAVFVAQSSQAQSSDDLPARCFRQPSGSMHPTLNEKQVFFAYRTPLAQIRRGDIVAFQVGPDPQAFWFKRVVGLPGGAVSMRDGDIILNGRKVERRSIGVEPPNRTREIAPGSNSPVRSVEESAVGSRPKHSGPKTVMRYIEQFPGEATQHQVFDSVDHYALQNVAEIRVPPGVIYVMGDNRHDSIDSRASDWRPSIGGGPVPFASVFGVVDMDSLSPGPICRLELLKADRLDD